MNIVKDVGSSDLLIISLSDPRYFFPADAERAPFAALTNGMVAACFIYAANWRSSISFMDDSSTPRVALPIAAGVTGGSGFRSVPRMNIGFNGAWTEGAPAPDQPIV